VVRVRDLAANAAGLQAIGEEGHPIVLSGMGCSQTIRTSTSVSRDDRRPFLMRLAVAGVWKPGQIEEFVRTMPFVSVSFPLKSSPGAQKKQAQYRIKIQMSSDVTLTPGGLSFCLVGLKLTRYCLENSSPTR